MDVLDPTFTISLGTIIAVSSLAYTWLKIAKSIKKGKDEHEAKILQAAKEADEAIKTHFEDKIEALKTDLANLEQSVGKDLVHLKESHNSEIKNLGEKIESLRDELKTQHSQLVSLLTKMVDNRD